MESKKAEKNKKVELYTDGACSGNPGPGGWGSILRFNSKEKELSGGAAETTNNRMELMAVIEGLDSLKEPCVVEVFTDSKYISDAFTKGWLENWQKNGWKTAAKKPVKNKDLWEKLVKLSTTHDLSWNWIKGHSGHPENERCDKLAVESRDKFSAKRD